MTIKQYIETLNTMPMASEPGKPSFVDSMIEQVDIWSNDSCRGYCIEAMRQCGVDDRIIREVLQTMSEVFEWTSVEEAETIFQRF